MSKTRNISEMILGALILLFSGGLLAIAYLSSDWSYKKGYELKADFDSVEGLREGNPVKINGVTVGSVLKIDLNPKTFSGVVTFRVRSDIRVAKDSSASITSESLLGGKAVKITPGGDAHVLEEGQTIFKTQASTNFEGLIQKFLFSNDKKEDTKNLDSQDKGSSTSTSSKKDLEKK